MLIDTHAHLTKPGQNLGDLSTVIERAKKAGVEKIVNISTTFEELESGIALNKLHPFIYNVASTTPHDAEKLGSIDFPRIAGHVKDLVAIGETGLDYHYEHSSKDAQKEFLIRYLHLSLEHNLPIVFHCREAFSDLFEVLDVECGPHYPPFILHCFTGTEKDAEGVISRGGYVSFSGIVTFKKSELLRTIARALPLDKILIETDTPYLAPQSRRGQVNEPAFVEETARLLAHLRGISFEEFAAATTQNAKAVFKI